MSTSFTDPSGSRTTEGQTKETYQVYEMTEGCRFYIERADPGETSNFSRLGEEWLGHLENGFSARDTVWTAPILYYPDGSATDGIVTVVDEQNRFIELFVRGLTGAVRSTKVAMMEGRNATSN